MSYPLCLVIGLWCIMAGHLSNIVRDEGKLLISSIFLGFYTSLAIVIC
jgi:hypothetical protein